MSTEFLTQPDRVLKWAGKPDQDTCDAWDAFDQGVAQRIAENEKARLAFERLATNGPPQNFVQAKAYYWLVLAAMKGSKL